MVFKTDTLDGFCKIHQEDAILTKRYYSGGPDADYRCDLLDGEYACDDCPLIDHEDEAEDNAESASPKRWNSRWSH